jgi:hypothetical protein
MKSSIATRSLRATVAALAALFSLPHAFAQDGGDDDLARKATDPTASLMSFQVNDWYTTGLHGADGSINQIVLRAAIPFDAFGAKHIMRVTQPFVTSSPADTGIVDTAIFDLVVFDMPWGRWGLGPVVSLPTGSDGLTTDKWSIGPAFGFVNSSQKVYSFGLFVQTLFSFAGKDSASDVGIVNIQPIFSYQLGGGRSVSLGSSQLVYDTEKSRWASMQFGLNYGQVVSAFGHKWRPNIEADYDFRKLTGNPAWTIRAGITLLLPTN